MGGLTAVLYPACMRSSSGFVSDLQRTMVFDECNLVPKHGART